MGTRNIKSEAEFGAEIKDAGGRVALFYSPWCPFCTSFMPVFDGRAKAGGGVFLKVSTDDLPALEDRFSVEVVPTVLFFKAGKLSRRLDGALGRGLNAEDLDAFLAACGLPEKGALK